jgi:soluble lytic murein transglycosylase-like protein
MIRKTVLVAIALTVMLCTQVQAAKVSEDIVKDTIVKQSLEMNIDPALALSIAKKESGFRHELRSPHGAVGVFQLLPSTAKRLGYNPYYLSENIKAGLTYYKMMYKMFGSTELALAAYNAGPGNVKRHGCTIPPYAETKRFVNVIMQDYNNQKKNPDPAIARVKSQKAVQLPKNETNVLKAPKDFEFPCLNEIPELKNSEPVMEIL